MNIIAGVSVGLVAIPQSMAYAELTGLPAHHGLYAAALPATAAAFFASSPYIQTGPVATTCLLTAAAISSVLPHGTPGEVVTIAALLALIVGATRLVLGLLRAGAVSYLMSQPALQGFVAAAALLIIASQVPAVVGLAPSADVVGAAVSALQAPVQWDPTTLALSAVTLVIVLGGQRLHRMFPGVLIAVVGATIFSAATGYQGPRVGEVPHALLPPLSVDLPWPRLPELLLPGVTIALVGFAEATSIAQTYAERARTAWNPSREFVSQGVANLVAGLTSGFPVGASFSRSAIGEMAGTTTVIAGGITGLTVLLFVPFASIIAPLPQAVLGAIVVASVLKLLNPTPLISAWRHSRPQGVVGFATFAATLVSLPHIEYAVLAGIGMALAVHVWREQEVRCEAERDGDSLELRPSGVIWFGAAPLFRQTMLDRVAEHRDAETIVINLSQVGRIDLTGAVMLRDLAKGLQGDVQLAQVPSSARELVERVCPNLIAKPSSGS